MPTQRLFIAVYPPAEALADLEAVVTQLPIARPHAQGLSLRPVPPEQWHVTLAFLGELEPDQASAAQSAMTAAASSAVTPQLQLAGGGRFDNGRAAAVWVGLRGDLEALHALATRLRAALTDGSVPYDARPYQPHLTLARPGDRLGAQQLEETLRRLDTYSGPIWPAASLVLMRSDHPVSNAYAEVATAPLPQHS